MPATLCRELFFSIYNYCQENASRDFGVARFLRLSFVEIVNERCFAIRTGGRESHGNFVSRRSTMMSHVFVL